jgi:hypothetical protein
MGVRSLLLALATALLLSAPHPALADTARTLCTIRDQRIDESSGLAASADRIWTINDGGSRLRVFELDRSCRVLRTIEAGIDPYDVEDLARARDGAFWLADIGDNELNRSTVALERLRPDGSATLFRLTYPDGPHDAEAVLLTPSGTLFIATKEPLASNVYTPAGALSATRPTPLRRWWSPAGRSRRTVGRWCCGRTRTRTSGRRRTATWRRRSRRGSGGGSRSRRPLRARRSPSPRTAARCSPARRACRRRCT